MESCVVINNPYSGGNITNHSFLDEISSSLRLHNYSVLVENLDRDKGKDISTLINRHGNSDLIAIIGGDGTLSEAVPSLVDSDTTVAYFPNGTANDFANMHGYSKNKNQLIEQVLSGDVRDIDIASINNNPFLYVSAIGAGTSASYSASSELKKKKGVFGYYEEAVRTVLAPHKKHEVIYTVDGKSETYGAIAIVVSNSTHIATAPVYRSGNVKLNDGLFEVFMVDAEDKSELFRSMLLIGCKGIDKSSGRIKYFQTDNLKLQLDTPFSENFSVDGNRYPTSDTDYEFKTAGKVRMLLPKSSAKLF